MARPPRIDPAGGYHHVMNRGVDRQRIFFTDDDRLDFGRLLHEVHELFGVTTIAYCLMDNHFHLVLYCPDGHLSDAMQRISSIFTRRVNDRVGRDGPLLRGRFRSIPITTDAYLSCAVRYVHRNCLDLPGVTDPATYRWCSHLAYLGGRPTASWLDTELVLELSGGRRRFGEFVAGDDTFPAGDRVLSADLRSLLELEVAESVDVDSERSRQGLVRTVLHLLEAGGDLTAFDDLRRELPDRGSPAERSALHRARQRMSRHPELASIVDRLSELIGEHRAAA